MSEVRSINALRADKLNDNSLVSPAECLEDAATDLRSGKREAQHCLALMLDTKDNAYSFGYSASNLKASEIVALLEVAKQYFVQMIAKP